MARLINDPKEIREAMKAFCAAPPKPVERIPMPPIRYVAEIDIDMTVDLATIRIRELP